MAKTIIRWTDTQPTSDKLSSLVTAIENLRPLIVQGVASGNEILIQRLATEAENLRYEVRIWEAQVERRGGLK